MLFNYRLEGIEEGQPSHIVLTDPAQLEEALILLDMKPEKVVLESIG